MDRILVAELPVHTHVGVTEEERASEQELTVDVELALDLRAAGRSDELRDTIDYERACRMVVAVATSGPFRLIEALAARMAEVLLAELGVAEVLVRVRKPGALSAWGARHAAVEIRRARDG